jgi:hypothetical protein
MLEVGRNAPLIIIALYETNPISSTLDYPEQLLGSFSKSLRASRKNWPCFVNRVSVAERLITLGFTLIAIDGSDGSRAFGLALDAIFQVDRPLFPWHLPCNPIKAGCFRPMGVYSTACPTRNLKDIGFLSCWGTLIEQLPQLLSKQ